MIKEIRILSSSICRNPLKVTLSYMETDLIPLMPCLITHTENEKCSVYESYVDSLSVSNQPNYDCFVW